MIVRIATEGQYEVPAADEEALDHLDNEAVRACEAGDADGFHTKFSELLEFVRGKGRQIPDAELAPSDLILPPPDTSMTEAREEFSAEGLIPE